MNKYLQTIVIAPVTSSSKPYPTRVEVLLEKTKGWIVLDQVRTIDKKRVIKVLDRLPDSCITAVKAVLKETFVD
jgi:mRNA interferase MazF